MTQPAPATRTVKVLDWNGGLHTRWHGAQESWVHQHKDGTTWEWLNPTTERFIPSGEAAAQPQPSGALREPRTVAANRLLMSPEASHIPGLRADLARVEEQARALAAAAPESDATYADRKWRATHDEAVAAQPAEGLPACIHSEGCICTEPDHAACCGTLRPQVLAALAAAQPQPQPSGALQEALESKRGYQDSIGRWVRDPIGIVVLWSDVEAALAAAPAEGRSLESFRGEELDVILATAQPAEGLDPERLVLALWQVMPMTPEYHSIGSWTEAARMIAAEYARLLREGE